MYELSQPCYILVGCVSVKHTDFKAEICWTEMLKDESNETDMISPTLPCLKAILTIPVATEGRGMRDRYEKLVHGILSACLLNVDEMRCALLFFY